MKKTIIKNIFRKKPGLSFSKKVIKYLVDKSIANADIKKACEDMNFLSKDIKNSPLEKFKIYCLMFSMIKMTSTIAI